MREGEAPVVPGFQMLERIGGGRSGEVYRARSEESGEIVALKVSHPSPRHGSDDVAFKLEYHFHSGLRHPHIVRAHQFGEIDDLCRYYTMELVEARPLSEIWAAGGIGALAEVTLAVCSALEYAHAQGILHGDIKPANLLVSVDGDGRPDVTRLADFGHAQRLGDPSPLVQGSLGYLAPERINGRRVDARSDLYSLGVTLFEAISGRLPFAVSTPRELFRAHSEFRSPSILELSPELDSAWASFLDSLISRNPESRPRSATATAERVSQLLGRRPTTGPSPASSTAYLGPTLAFVGRAAELQRMRDFLREPVSPRTIIVTGDAGVGKSRLADEFVRSVEMGGGTAFRSDARESVATGFRVLRRVWQEGELHDLTGDPPADRSGTGETPRPHLRQAELERLVDTLLADTGPSRETVFVFDSLECADLDSFAFLSALQRRLEGTNSLLLLVGRDEKALARYGEGNSLAISLSPFSAAEIRQFLGAELGEMGHESGSPAPPLDDEEMTHLVTWMSEHTGGNPRSVESYLGTLVRQRHLRRRERSWSLDRNVLEDEALVGMLEDGASERIRQLPDDVRRLLELASVAGSDFDASILAAVSETGGEEVPRLVAESLRLGHLHRSRNSSTSYRFAEFEMRQAIYGSLEPDRRRALHLKLAELLEPRAETEGVAATVAYHLEQARETDRARKAYVRAAVQHRDEGAYQEAGKDYRKAWELHSPKQRRRVPAFAPEWIRTLYTNSQFDDAVRTADEILAAATDSAASDPSVASMLILRGISATEAGDREEGHRVLASLLGSGAQIGNPKLEAWALVEFGWLELMDGRTEHAWECVERARSIGIEADAPYTIGLAELRLGIMSWRENDCEKALEWLARAHDHLTEAGAHDLLPAVWGNQGLSHWNLLQGRQAIRFNRRAAEGFVRQHRRAEAARSFQNLAFFLIEMGHWRDAEESLATAELLNRTVRGPREASYYEYCRARMAYYRGRLHEAEDHIDRALDLAREVDDTFVEIGHKTVKGLIRIAAGRADEATRIGEECLVASREISYQWGVGKSLFLLGQAARVSQQRERALEYLQQGARECGVASQQVMLFKIQLALAEVLAESGDLARAKSTLADCRAMQATSESALWLGLVRLSEGRVDLLASAPEHACHVLSDAYETFASLGADRLRAETLVALACARRDMGNLNAAQSAWRQVRSLHEQLGLSAPESPFDEAEGGGASSLSTVHRVLEAAASVSREITALQSVDQVLEKILDVAITYLGTERGVVALIDPESGDLSVRHARNMDRESIADGLDISRSVLARGGNEGEIVHTGDALADPRLSLQESIRRERIRSLISLPIRLRDRILGALYMDHRELTDLFGREERLFLQFIADMAAIGIRNAQRFELAQDQVRSLRGEIENDEFLFPDTVVGRSDVMRRMFRKATRAARSGKVILLTGPSGSGKDHLARILHNVTARKGEFVDCPLPTLHAALIESELFGVARGTATQVEPRPGLVEMSEGGTLFLNEIGDLPFSLQPVLLNFIDRREYRRVGGQKPKRLDALIVCATNQDLEQRVAEGIFREDLFFRLTESMITLPALREHPEDISELVDLFLREIEQKGGRDGLVIRPLALDHLMRCPWRGNVRELRTCIGKAVENSPDGTIELHHLESPSLRNLGPPSDQGSPLDAEVEAVEIRLIKEALTRTGGNVTQAAKILGWSEAKLRRRIDRYGLRHLGLRRLGRPPKRTPGSDRETPPRHPRPRSTD